MVTQTDLLQKPNSVASNTDIKLKTKETNANIIVPIRYKIFSPKSEIVFKNIVKNKLNICSVTSLYFFKCITCCPFSINTSNNIIHGYHQCEVLSCCVLSFRFPSWKSDFSDYRALPLFVDFEQRVNIKFFFKLQKFQKS